MYDSYVKESTETFRVLDLHWLCQVPFLFNASYEVRLMVPCGLLHHRTLISVHSRRDQFPLIQCLRYSTYFFLSPLPPVIIFHNFSTSLAVSQLPAWSQFSEWLLPCSLPCSHSPAPPHLQHLCCVLVSLNQVCAILCHFYLVFSISWVKFQHETCIQFSKGISRLAYLLRLHAGLEGNHGAHTGHLIALLYQT